MSVNLMRRVAFKRHVVMMQCMKYGDNKTTESFIVYILWITSLLLNIKNT